MKNQVIPIITCIDVEPDLRITDPQNPMPWVGYEKTWDFFRNLRSKISSSTGSPPHLSWFLRMDPQVSRTYGSPTWAVSEHPNIIEEISRQGDDIGLHVHEFRWNSERRNWIMDNANPEWIEHCIRSSFSAFNKVFSRHCRSFRFGGRFISNEVVNLLEQLDVYFDLTVEPGQEGVCSLKNEELLLAPPPDFHGIPRHPYIPQISNYKVPDPDRKNGVWMIPLSTCEISGILALGLRLFRRVVYNHKLPETCVTLYLLQEPPIFRKVVDELLHSMDRPYLTLLLRSDSIMKPYFSRNIKKNLNYIFSHPMAKQFAFSTPQEAMQHLGYLN